MDHNSYTGVLRCGSLFPVTPRPDRTTVVRTEVRATTTTILHSPSRKGFGRTQGTGVSPVKSQDTFSFPVFLMS